MTDQEFLILLDKYKRNELGQEGIHVLMQEIAQGKRDSLVQEDILRTMEGFDDEQRTLTPGAEDQILSGLLGTIRPPARRTFLVHYGWHAAAAVLLLILTGGAFRAWQSHKKPAALVAASTVRQPDAAPGGNKALLTLADGAIIALDSTHTGALTSQGNVSVFARSGQLVYNETTRQPAAGISYNTLRTPKRRTISAHIAGWHQSMAQCGFFIALPNAVHRCNP
ncbi:hypothetical protein [Chitinophaga agrisoli]|uniref:hypothetical protein n=1 Tax=Chitinophaga agrisoli TaxID=2607653 RepID=UPI001661FD1E|nr:hypothetical protein [Chitinophaga agrisoli]